MSTLILGGTGFVERHIVEVALHCVFISSISVYSDFARSDKLTGSMCTRAAMGTAKRSLESYGALPPVVTSDENPLNDAKIALGRQLYYDTRLSKDKDVSCASCHVLDNYGMDGQKLSAGHQKQLGTRNTPSVYNSAGFFAPMWDGRAANVEEQVKIQLQAPLEMHMTPKLVEERVRGIAAYVTALNEAFAGEKRPVSTKAGDTASQKRGVNQALLLIACGPLHVGCQEHFVNLQGRVAELQASQGTGKSSA